MTSMTCSLSVKVRQCTLSLVSGLLILHRPDSSSKWNQELMFCVAIYFVQCQPQFLLTFHERPLAVTIELYGEQLMFSSDHAQVAASTLNLIQQRCWYVACFLFLFHHLMHHSLCRKKYQLTAAKGVRASFSDVCPSTAFSLAWPPIRS